MTRLVAFLSVAFFFVFALPAHPANAAVANEAGAARLKTLVTKYLDDQKTAIRAQDQELRAQGEVLVEPAGSYYAITMPHLSLVNGDGSYTDIGILAINALPGEKDGEWKMTVAVPTPIIGYDAQKKPDLRIDLGAQSFTGLWNEKFDNFTKLDARYQNIKAVQTAKGVTVAIPSASILYNLTPSAGGATWSGPIRYTMDNIEVSRRDDPGVSKIGKVEMTMNVLDYDPDAVRRYQDQIKTAENPSVPFMELIGNAWDGFDSTLTLQGLNLTRPAIPGSPEGKLAIKDATLHFGAKGFRNDSVTMNLRTQYDGLNLVPAPSGFDEATPARLNLDIHIEKLPFGELVRLSREGIETANSQPDGGKIAGMQAAKLIPQVLTNAGTHLKIDQSYLGNALYNLDLDGILNADLNAVMGAEGKAKLEVTGLDALLALLKTRLKDPSLEADAKARMNNALVTLTVLQLAGQQGTNADGKPVRSYNLELTKDGKIMINGADLSMLKALAGAGKKPEEAPQSAP